MEFKNNFSPITLFISKYEHFYLLAVFFSLAILSRVLFQALPSVDPLGAIILLYGYKKGWKEGALFGASAYYASNFFVIGGQGIWTIPMAIGAAGIGACGGIFKNKYAGIITGTVFYELVVNTMLAFMFNPLFALPFAAVHLVSNIGFVGAADIIEKRVTRTPAASRT
ncbi:MAG: hypothetical protein JW834_00875 [Candidatus Diapherotrites archaeon]|nr:hypothetical protein [Candidatus Diapherotrites archaeon]